MKFYVNIFISLLILAAVVAIIWLLNSGSSNTPGSTAVNTDSNATNPTTATYTDAYLTSLGITINYSGPAITGYQYVDNTGFVVSSTDRNFIVSQRLLSGL